MEITKENLLAIIAGSESETIEFKEKFGDEALETVGAFANARGGNILIGVTNSGEICGVQIGKKSLEDIANRIQEATDPRIQPSISIIEPDKKKLIAIYIAPRTGVPLSIRGRYFLRVGGSN